MTTMTCERFDDQLQLLLDGELSSAERDAVEAHAASCSRCGPLLAEVRAIVRDAAALPELQPTRDLWDGIAARIEAPVVELEPRQAPVVVRRGLPWRVAAAAAAVLVAVTALATWQIAADSSTATVPPAADRDGGHAANHSCAGYSACPHTGRAGAGDYDRRSANSGPGHAAGSGDSGAKRAGGGAHGLVRSRDRVASSHAGYTPLGARYLDRSRARRQSGNHRPRDRAESSGARTRSQQQISHEPPQ